MARPTGFWYRLLSSQPARMAGLNNGPTRSGLVRAELRCCLVHQGRRLRLLGLRDLALVVADHVVQFLIAQLLHRARVDLHPHLVLFAPARARTFIQKIAAATLCSTAPI